MNYFEFRELGQSKHKITAEVAGFNGGEYIEVKVSDMEADKTFTLVAATLFAKDGTPLRVYEHYIKGWDEKWKLAAKIDGNLLSVIGISTFSLFEVKIENVQTGNEMSIDFKIESSQAEGQIPLAVWGSISEADILSGNPTSKYFHVDKGESTKDILFVDVRGYLESTFITTEILTNGTDFEVKMSVRVPFQEEPLRTHCLDISTWNDNCSLRCSLTEEYLNVHVENGTDHYVISIKNELDDEPGLVFDVLNENDTDDEVAEWGYATEEDILGEDGWEKKYA